MRSDVHPHELLRAALTADDQLDDIKRTRIWNALEDRIAEPAPRRARWPFAIAAAAMAATAAAVLLVHRDRPVPSIVVADSATLTQPIGPHTRAALIGPAQLEVIGVPGATTVVRLRSGTFLAEFDGGPGRSLRVEAPHVVVEVVGTVFAVEVGNAATCVSVQHGKVRVTTTTAETLVAAQERYCSDAGMRPISPEIDEALRHHARVLTARSPEPPTPPADPSASTIADVVAPVAPEPDRVVTTPAPPRPTPPREAPRHREPRPVRVATPEPTSANAVEPVAPPPAPIAATPPPAPIAATPAPVPSAARTTTTVE
ncbi:MAG TPA: FecR domain-containing protein, partial [Kofleriaceae bacterium]